MVKGTIAKVIVSNGSQSTEEKDHYKSVNNRRNLYIQVHLDSARDSYKIKIYDRMTIDLLYASFIFIEVFFCLFSSCRLNEA
jgi:hypothetical protein